MAGYLEGENTDNPNRSCLVHGDGFNPLHPPTHTLLQQPAAPAAAPQQADKFGEAAQHLPSEVPTTHTSMFASAWIQLYFYFSKNEIRAGGKCPPGPGSRRFPDGQPAAGAPTAARCQQASASARESRGRGSLARLPAPIERPQGAAVPGQTPTLCPRSGTPGTSTGLHLSPPGGKGCRLSSSPPSRTKYSFQSIHVPPDV